MKTLFVSPGIGFCFRLCLVFIKFEGKCKGKKIKSKSRGKEKMKKNKKLN